MLNYGPPNAPMYSAIISAGILIGGENLQDDMLRINVGNVPVQSTNDVAIDGAIAEKCGTQNFVILASCDVTLTGNRRLFVSRVEYVEANGMAQRCTISIWILPPSEGTESTTVVPLTPAQEEKVRNLLNF